MKSSLVPLLLGLAFIAGAIATNSQQRTLQLNDVRDIDGLRAELDSAGSALARARKSGEPDSARLAVSVAERTNNLQRREFHVPSRQEAIDRWWTLTGPGTVFSTVGALFIVIAALTRRRARARRADHSG